MIILVTRWMIVWFDDLADLLDLIDALDDYQVWDFADVGNSELD